MADKETFTTEPPLHEAEVDVNTDPVPAQVTGPEHATPETLEVHETHVNVDRVITDASDPLAVIIPPEGRGNPVTPLGESYAEAKTPEEVFAATKSKTSTPKPPDAKT